MGFRKENESFSRKQTKANVKFVGTVKLSNAT